MKKVKAIWEKKNLNLNVLEIEFDKEDKMSESLITEIEQYDYIVAKVPIKQINLMQEIENSKFYFIETQFDLIKKLTLENMIPKRLIKISKSIESKKIANENHLDFILENVSDNMFDTDRIALDPKFGPDIANKRYKNWIISLFNSDDSEVFSIINNNNSIGFYIINVKSNSMRILLGGLYSKYKMFGLGYSLVVAPINLANSKNIKIIKGRISSNNLPVLKIYQEYGYFINDIRYIFRRINKKKKKS